MLSKLRTNTSYHTTTANGRGYSFNAGYRRLIKIHIKMLYKCYLAFMQKKNDFAEGSKILLDKSVQILKITLLNSL